MRTLKLLLLFVSAASAHAAEPNHSKINSELGLPGDETTREIFEFLSRAVNGTADQVDR